jgi:CP family cyanate transporter-like MFS transporter
MKPVDAPSVAAHRTSPVLLALTLFLVALNLRPALAGVAPVLAAIRDGTGLSAAGAGGLTTLPVLCFGLIAPFGVPLARRFTVERTILICLLLLAAGASLRILFGLPGLFAGTFVTGASIGIVMVLLPSIIKRDFAENTGFMTGVYTMALCMGAAVAAGVAVPIQQLAGGDWRAALAFWSLPALIAAAAWARSGRHAKAGRETTHRRVSGLRRDPLAWQVAFHMGLQSVLAYCVFGWLPTILIDRGFSPLTAGAVLSASIAAQLVTALTGPWIATRRKDQRATILAVVSITIIGLMACMYAPAEQIWVWAIVLGLGQGGSFSIATMLVVLRSSNSEVVASLAGMTQLIGYVLAASGPFIAGLLRDLTGGWNFTAVFFVFIAFAAAAAGMGAGRNLHVTAKLETAP